MAPASPRVFAAFTVAVPVAIFIVVLALLDTRRSGEPAALGLTLLTAALVLTAAATASALALPLSTAIMVVPVALLLAYHLTAARQATRQPGHEPAVSDASRPPPGPVGDPRPPDATRPSR
jgi:hypothetical protein